jgi:TetR/AcrR family transcriptional regulator, regulator of cefoperazone and chloramphenicol sensitivity
MGTDVELNLETRNRLLVAAGETFAENGFRATTVREICQRAGANVAAVNYHFGDKERLYSAVLQYAHTCAMEKYPPQPPQSETLSAGERLGAFVRSFLQRLFDKERPAWLSRMIAREIIEPTGALDALVENSIRPQRELVISIVKEILGEAATPDRASLCAGSVIGQCLYYYHSRAVLSRLDPTLTYTPEVIERLADHVTAFSVAALRGLSADRQERGQ